MAVILQQNVPTCPRCSAMMHKRMANGHLYFICGDCKGIWKVLGNGQAEIELVVSDNAFEVVHDFYDMGQKDGQEALEMHMQIDAYEKEIQE